MTQELTNQNGEVDRFLEGLDHPLILPIRAVRDVILAADPRMTETVKWSSPTFMYKGNLASINVRAKKLVSVLFHEGAGIPDPSGLLEGDGDHARTARFTDLADVEHKKDALTMVVRNWIELRDRPG